MVSREKILKAKGDSLSHLRSIYGDDAETILAERRYGFISGLLKETLKKPPVEGLTISDRIDRVVVSRAWGIPIFLAAMLAMFEFTFTLSAPLMDWIDSGFGWIGKRAVGISPDWLGSLLSDGIIGGVGSVLVFIPPIFLLFVALAVLEDCGYMARAAFVMDRLMHRIGLHGRSFIPMILGFGCNVPAIMATRAIENPKDRLTTILINPLMSCGARLPIYTLLAAAFFTAYQGVVVFSFYFLGIILAILMALLLRRTILSGPSGHFVMELPSYRLPTIKGVLVHMWERGRMFLIRAGTIIFSVVVLIWFLGSMPWGVEYASSESWIAQIGSFFAPIFAPCGFGQWQAATGLIFGFLAKEVVVGTFGTLFGVEEGALGATIMAELGWSPLIAYAFMAFCLIYVPCIASIAVIRGETNSWRWPAFTIGYTIALGWIVATLIYQVGRLFIG
jgi:ferrous iron transport protein B